LALGFALFGAPSAPELGPIASYAQAAAMPEFGLGGRLDLWGTGGYVPLFRHGMTGLGSTPRVVLGLVLVVLAVWFSSQRRQLPFAAWAMLLTGLGLWLALRLFPRQLMFGLYLPNRHSRWVILGFGMMALAALLYGLAKASLRRYGPFPTRLGLMILAPVAAAIALWPQAHAQWSQPVDEDLQRTQAFLRGLPSDTLIAAHPDLANYLPLYTRHSVLASTETSMPWMLGYYERIKPRLEASLKAAYVTSIDDLDRILGPFGVDVMVTSPEVWNKKGYLEPWNAEVLELQSVQDGQVFALREPPADRILFRSGDYYVVKVQGQP
jgi:hypothetical protein